MAETPAGIGSDAYADLDATTIDDEPYIPTDDEMEQPFVEPVTTVKEVCPNCGKPL